MSDPLLPDNTWINIEVAHLRSWHSADALSSAEESLLIADEYQQSPHHGLGEQRFAVSVLVDDKAVSIPDRASWLQEVSERWPHFIANIDFFCFESDLATVADLFIARLVSGKRGRRAREIERYRNKHGRVACSHDIAIWHSLRLGLLGRHDRLIGRGPHWQEGTTFYCSQAVSILEEDNRDEEARASEILRECSDDRHLRVETIFYAP